MSHLGKQWFSNALDAHYAGQGNLYAFGIRYIQEYHERFKKAGADKLPAYHTNYQPNPFRFQYDLMVFIWLNYYNIHREECRIIRDLHTSKPKAGHDETLKKLVESGELYEITRTDFMFAAGEMRWPTTILADGSMHGKFVRDPWSEKRIDALGHRDIKYDFFFGGGGQGKTLVTLASALMIYDYFLFTDKGARCMISTVNKDKLNSVPWAYLCSLNSATETGISLTAGRSKIGGEWTLNRPKSKDKGGVFKGILIGNNLNDQGIIDKLTGSHGHPFIMYIMDEAQSTPNAPIMASNNFTMHAKDFRIVGSGNYGENTDTLAKNIKPNNGWDSVNEHTGSWISTTENGAKAIVLHFNNEDSPGMTEEGHKKWPHLPHKGILDKKFEDISRRNMNNISYRRFWVGYRLEDAGENVVISDSMVRNNLANNPVQLKSILHSFFSFDSAPAEKDRNLQGIFQEGVCEITDQRVFGPVQVYALDKATESIKYYQESAEQLLTNAKKHNIISGGGIVDWTGRPAQSEIMQQKNFQVQRLIYNKGVPNGIKKDDHTRRVERKIYLNIELDFKQDVPLQEVCAHHVAENEISLGAWALRQYVLAGRVRGLNQSLLNFIKSQNSIEDELFSRKFRMKNSVQYGERFHLEPKTDFKELYGFSPDLLDILFQAAWYMLRIRNLPLTPIAINDKMLEDEGEKDELEEHQDLWLHDDLSEVGA